MESYREAALGRRVWAAASIGGRVKSVGIRVGGKLVGGGEGEVEEEIEREVVPDSGMREFLPFNGADFEEEIRCREVENIGWVSGSLKCHGTCAIAVHNMRSRRFKSAEKARRMMELERDCSRKCGRTMPLGVDRIGRMYWKVSLRAKAASCPRLLYMRAGGACEASEGSEHSELPKVAIYEKLIPPNSRSHPLQLANDKRGLIVQDGPNGSYFR